MRFLNLFGIDRSANICSYIARTLSPLIPVTKIARKNLKDVFGNSIDHYKIIDELWDNFGRFIGEFPYVNNLTDEEINKRVELIGLAHLQEFNKTNRPFILFTGHFANWDLAIRILTKLYPKFGVVYRKSNNPYVDKIINTSRSSDNLHLIEKGPFGAKNLIKSIKAGHSIVMLVDQKMNDGIEVPFFGRPAMTPHAIAKFALQFGYPIIPCQIIRTQGSYFKVIIYPELKLDKTEDKDIDHYNIMLKINQILENWVRQNPSQWFWFHNRWKK